MYRLVIRSEGISRLHEIGGFVGTGVTYRTQNLTSNWAWRIPYMTQWLWPIPLIILTHFAPESPWWLVRHGKLEEAEKSVKRLGSKAVKERSRDTVANMVSSSTANWSCTRRLTCVLGPNQSDGDGVCSNSQCIQMD